MSPSKFLLIKDSFLNSVIQSFKTTILKAKTLKNGKENENIDTLVKVFEDINAILETIKQDWNENKNKLDEAYRNFERSIKKDASNQAIDDIGAILHELYDNLNKDKAVLRSRAEGKYRGTPEEDLESLTYSIHNLQFVNDYYNSLCMDIGRKLSIIVYQIKHDSNVIVSLLSLIEEIKSNLAMNNSDIDYEKKRLKLGLQRLKDRDKKLDPTEIKAARTTLSDDDGKNYGDDPQKDRPPSARRSPSPANTDDTVSPPQSPELSRAESLIHQLFQFYN